MTIAQRSARNRVSRFHGEERIMVILRWIVVPLLAVHVVLATISGYRAIWQIWRVEVRVDSQVLHPGSTIYAAVKSSGRTEASMVVELRQGALAETLAVRWLPRNGTASYDPRPQNASVAIALTPEVLAPFTAGPAVVRVTGNGGMQWLRVPPPEVREVGVVIVAEPPGHSPPEGAQGAQGTAHATRLSRLTQS